MWSARLPTYTLPGICRRRQYPLSLLPSLPTCGISMHWRSSGPAPLWAATLPLSASREPPSCRTSPAQTRYLRMSTSKLNHRRSSRWCVEQRTPAARTYVEFHTYLQVFPFRCCSLRLLVDGVIVSHGEQFACSLESLIDVRQVLHTRFLHNLRLHCTTLTLSCVVTSH